MPLNRAFIYIFVTCYVLGAIAAAACCLTAGYGQYTLYLAGTFFMVLVLLLFMAWASANSNPPSMDGQGKSSPPWHWAALSAMGVVLLLTAAFMVISSWSR